MRLWTCTSPSFLSGNGYQLELQKGVCRLTCHPSPISVLGLVIVCSGYYDKISQSVVAVQSLRSRPTLWDPRDCSPRGTSVLLYLWEFAQIHVHWVGDALAISSSVTPFFCLQSFPASGSLPVGQLFASGSQSTGASASASILPMNIQGWFPFRTVWFIISLQSKGLSRAFSSTIQSHQFFRTQPSLWPNSHIRT